MDDRRACGPAASPGDARAARGAGARRLLLLARHQRLLGLARLRGCGAARARARGRRCLPSAGCVPGNDLVGAARKGRARPRRCPPARNRLARLRRGRCHHRAARYGRRSQSAVPARPGAGRDQHPQRRRLQGHRGDQAGRCDEARAPRDGDGGPARRGRRTGGAFGCGDGRLCAADPGRRLAARRRQRLGPLLAHRPADRGARACRRSQ